MEKLYHCTETPYVFHCRPDSIDSNPKDGPLKIDQKIDYDKNKHGCGYWKERNKIKGPKRGTKTEISDISCKLYHSFWNCVNQRKDLRKEVFGDEKACYLEEGNGDQVQIDEN